MKAATSTLSPTSYNPSIFAAFLAHIVILANLSLSMRRDEKYNIKNKEISLSLGLFIFIFQHTNRSLSDDIRKIFGAVQPGSPLCRLSFYRP